MKPKVALVYDRVNTAYGGAEKVLLALHKAFPNAPLYTSVYHPRAKWANIFEIKTSFLQKIPFASKFHRLLVPLMPLAFESFDLSEYDIIISITSAEAKGVITQPHQLHICYLLTPTRYLYSHRAHYEQTNWPFKIPILRFFSQKIFDYLTWWDQVAAQRPDIIIPISNLVKDRAKSYYHLDSADPIYPPFDPDELTTPAGVESYLPYYLPKEFYLVISRLVPYKRIDLAIQASQRLNKKIVIIGTGPQESELKKIANQNTYFLGNVTNIQRQAIISQAQAILMPGVEDFGITAIESFLSKKPIILHQKSGAAELIKNEAGVILLQKLSINNLVAALEKIASLEFKNSSPKKKLAKYAINDFTKRFQTTVFKFYEQQKGRS
ncbi:MAG: glycosyltransferase [Candidatus Pacebacteria bacterium]|jgi:glycosyltransferase involved in cell wall biosynthesis|nr:glycosyltransferase [Candidatus Paceibacterota bacterium]MBT3512253.1 glycosyltransferase [Candidatus Paceibacterota bacterium]MBT4004797.1 glycosyltransferase [Candidatus Paceibacterota bacterium]MBT4358693.1 glycosyltransferase [Candidatus Paceibacterota bacterium]MBT4681004.1 glycosyltransferase [Candidatus Paceibacterota bacterium]